MKVISTLISPVKGCRMADVPALNIKAGVITGDRIFVLKRFGSTLGESQFLSMRHEPKMARIVQEICGNCVVLDFEGGTAGTLAIRASDIGIATDIRIWEEGDEPNRFALKCDPKWSAWFSEVLKQKLTLLQLDPSRLKTNVVEFEVMHTVFHDAAPIHVVSQSSLEWFRRIEALDATAMRFRANIIVETNLEPFAEDAWDGKIVRIGGNPFRVQKKTVRCHVPYLDPFTGEKTPEMAKQLAGHRKFKAGILFGLYLFPLFSDGTITAGDEVTVQ